MNRRKFVFGIPALAVAAAVPLPAPKLYLTDHAAITAGLEMYRLLSASSLCGAVAGPMIGATISNKLGSERR